MLTCMEVANYLLSKTDEEAGDVISNLKLQKLVYYVQGFSLAMNNRPMFEEDIYAWQHGPVVPSLYHNFKDNGAFGIPKPVDFDVSKVVWFHFSRRGFEEAQLKFDINADLSSLIHVNTRLFYAYILAEWGEDENDEHKIVLWDKLIKREDPSFVEKNVTCNFNLRQVGKTLKGKTVKLSFKIQLVPFVGFFRTHTLVEKNFTMPQKYSDQ